MPLFEYKCRACGEKFEKLVWDRENADIRCPKCGSQQAERQLSSFATQGGSCAPSSGFS